MANVSAPLQNDQVKAILSAGARAIDGRGVVVERDHLRDCEGNGSVTNEEIAAISCNQKIVAKYNGHEAAPEWANVFAGQIGQIITRIDQMEAVTMEQFAQMEAVRMEQFVHITARIEAMVVQLAQIGPRMNQMDARMEANHARTYNASKIHDDDFFLRPVVKYNPGYPGPRLHQFHLNQQEYAVGMAPPCGLLPETLLGIQEIDCANLKAIHWFYALNQFLLYS